MFFHQTKPILYEETLPVWSVHIQINFWIYVLRRRKCLFFWNHSRRSRGKHVPPYKHAFWRVNQLLETGFQCWTGSLHLKYNLIIPAGSPTFTLPVCIETPFCWKSLIEVHLRYVKHSLFDESVRTRQCWYYFSIKTVFIASFCWIWFHKEAMPLQYAPLLFRFQQNGPVSLTVTDQFYYSSSSAEHNCPGYFYFSLTKPTT